jgi:Ni/Co efflux regulator RcnB
MRKLSLLTLAASVAFPTVALAQVAHPGPRPGHMVHQGGSGMTMHHRGRFMHPGPNFPHRRLHRGFVIHPFWFGPQFHIQNWQMYGFADPGRDRRWVRYYDDAYLVDDDGRVMDERYGLDWDEYGERWEMADGIPAYYGRGDYHPDDGDRDWVERHRGWDYGSYGDGDRYGQAAGYDRGPPPGCHPAPNPCGSGAGYGGYGYYGYGVAYPIIIETTVWGGATYYEEVTEEVVEVRHRPRRHYRAPPPPRPRPRPRPPAGERG